MNDCAKVSRETTYEQDELGTIYQFFFYLVLKVLKPCASRSVLLQCNFR